MAIENIHHSNTQLQSTKWIIDARWYYVLLAFLLSIIANEDTGIENALIISGTAVLITLLSNFFFYFYLRNSDKVKLTEQRLTILNLVQISIDLCFFFIIILVTGGGVNSIGHAFFSLTIMVSMILFGFRGSIAVAAVSGCLVFLSVFVHLGLLTPILHGGVLLINREASLELTKVGILFLVYLLMGFFGGYISRLLRARDLLLIEQITKEEGHVRRLEELTIEFDKSAKLLVRRDLELSGANEKLTQLDQMKSEIISIVAHQLRTPLSAIKWTLKILLDEDAGPLLKEQHELISKGFESNERMIALINDMLAVDRLESGKIKYSFVPVQFEELVADMIRALLPLATQKNIHVEFTSPETLMPKIKIDPDKMRDVLQNLIDNAIKYTPKDGVVAVGVAIEKEKLHFWVKDNGIGIPQDEQDKIFSRFFRANNAVHTETDGSGLGLFIAQSVVIRHAGNIWFESTIGAGSTFHVTLPFSS